jgi:DNA transposition AAA+ family ATPase
MSHSIAPLANVSLLSSALDKALKRPAHLPGLVAFYGPSGIGKSFSAAYAANRYQAYYVECKSSWTRKALLAAILNSMGIVPAKTLPEMTDQASEQLALSGKPLIIDEMDHIVEKKAVEIIRDLYEGSQGTILMIGEECLPSKLKAWERFHNRILDWVPAQLADIDDCKLLARLYSPDVVIADDLLIEVTRSAKGCVRRMCVNIEQIRRVSLDVGCTELSRKDWGDRSLYTGEAPKRRL